MVSATVISKTLFENQFKSSLYSFLQHEIPYAEILEGLYGGMRQVRKNDLIFKRMNGLLFVHDQSQDTALEFWRIAALDNFEIKEQIV